MTGGKGSCFAQSGLRAKQRKSAAWIIKINRLSYWVRLWGSRQVNDGQTLDVVWPCGQTTPIARLH